MACCGPAQTPEEKAQAQHSKHIDADLKKDNSVYSKEIKLLLLGTGESGKSTVAKQMKLIHIGNFTQEELVKIYKPIVHSNIVTGMRMMIAATQRYGFLISEANEQRAQGILDQDPRITSVTPALAEDIKKLWLDDAIQRVFLKGAEYHLPEVTKYCMENIDRMAAVDYVPTEQDALRCRARTSGILETEFQIEDYKYRMVDVGGQRSERKKWIHCFQSVTAIIFCVAISEYDMKLFEDEGVNRMHESLELFGEISNNPFFQETAFIIFFNKKDLFEEKIKVKDLTCCFPEYTGGCDFTKATEFIKEKFISIPRKKREIFTHITCATDKNSMTFVFNATRQFILTKILNKLGF